MAKANSGGAPAVGAWVIWANSWDGPEVGPTVNPLAGDDVAAAVGGGGPFGGMENPFVAGGGPPTEIEPGN